MATLREITRFFRGLPGMTDDSPTGAGAAIGCNDRWVFEVQPDGARWAVAAKVWQGEARVTVAWRFGELAELEAARAVFAEVAAAESARLSLHRLKRGKRYRVLRAFTDYYGKNVEPDTVLTFRELHYLPHDGGYTAEFAERSLYFQEEAQAGLLAAFDAYFIPAD